MTTRATFTQADLQRAIRAAAREGVVARVVKTKDGPALEFVPAPPTLTADYIDPTIAPHAPKEKQPGEW